MTTDLITITPPNGNADIGAAMYALVLKRERELKAEFAAIAEKLTPEHYAETKSEWTRLKKIDGELKDIIDGVERGAVKYAACDALLVQLNATRKNLKAVYAENWEKFCALRDADKEPPELFEYVAEFRMTQADFDRLATKWEREGLRFRARRVKDNESAKVGKLFEENV